MEIIVPGSIPNTKERFECTNCGCIFKCDASEYRFHPDQREGDWIDCNCPTCGIRVTKHV